MQVTPPCDVNSPPGGLILSQSRPLPLTDVTNDLSTAARTAEVPPAAADVSSRKHLLALAALLHCHLSLGFPWELLFQVHPESDQGLDRHTSGSWELGRRQKQRMLRPP